MADSLVTVYVEKKKIYPHFKIFRETKLHVWLISRNFCQKTVIMKFNIFHTVLAGPSKLSLNNTSECLIIV